MSAQPGRPPAAGEQICDARLRDTDPAGLDFICTAVAGHSPATRHAAYGSDGALIHTWPQEPSAVSAGERPDWLPTDAELAESKRINRIVDLTPGQRVEVLAVLAGTAPEALDAALESVAPAHTHGSDHDADTCPICFPEDGGNG